MKLNFTKLNGLIPVVVQDDKTMQVLMLGFMNEEAYKQTIATGKVTFWSRSKKRLWQKGETSGNFLEVVSIREDCDNDSLLITANPNGKICHKGRYSCFGEKKRTQSQLKDLYELINDRKKKMPDNSYTTSLFKKGLNEIVKKIGEESVEVIIAAKSGSKKRMREETADLLYHILVLLVEKEIKLEDIKL